MRTAEQWLASEWRTTVSQSPIGPRVVFDHRTKDVTPFYKHGAWFNDCEHADEYDIATCRIDELPRVTIDRRRREAEQRRIDFNQPASPDLSHEPTSHRPDTEVPE